MKGMQVPKNSWEGTGLFLQHVAEVLEAIALSMMHQATVTQKGAIFVLIVAITLLALLELEVVLIATDT
jgi:signal transduction histidine kinase